MAELRDYKNKDFSLTLNKRMNGIELRFTQKMSDEQIAEIKEAGFKWSKRQQMWYAYQNEKSVQYATSLIEYYENTLSADEFNQEVEKNLETILNEDSENVNTPQFKSFDRLKILSVEQIENPIKEVTIDDLAELIRQRAELDRKITAIKEVIDNNGNKIDVSSEQSRDFALEMNNLQNSVDENNETNTSVSTAENKEIELTAEDLEIAKKFIPPMEYSTLIENASHGEETEHFKQKIKHVADMGHILYENKDGKSYNSKTGLHDKGFVHYFLANSDWYISEVDENNIGFGFAILNGDTRNAEYGYIDLNEITTLNIHGFIQAELDIYSDDSMSMEHAIVQKYPELKKELIGIDNEVANNVEQFDFAKLADDICQYAYEQSGDGFNYYIDFQHIAELANGKSVAWVKENLEKIGEALEEHNDELLLEFNLNDALEEDELSLNFCSVGDDTNELFKKDENGRWVRKTDKELELEYQEANTGYKGKTYTFFVKDTAEFEQFAEFEPITNLTADEAIRKYAELQREGKNCGIGINIPGDFIFDDAEGQGAVIFVRDNVYQEKAVDTFKIFGDTFINQLKEANEHSENLINAYEELYDAALSHNLSENLNVERPDFLFLKTEELYQKPSLNYNFDLTDMLDDLLAKEFETVDYRTRRWTELLEQGADAKKALKVAAADANLYDNFQWLSERVSDNKLKEYFADTDYAEEVYNLAKKSVTNDRETWTDVSGIDSSFYGFKKIAALCNKTLEADEYYQQILKEEGYEEKDTDLTMKALSKLEILINDNFLKVPEPETTPEERQARYNKWYKAEVDEIIEEIKAGNAEIIEALNNFDVKGNFQYKLLPELYQKVQDKIKADYDEKKIPYVVMLSSESPVFPSDNKVYTVKEFNELLLQADKEFHNRKEYAEKKYGSADNYWELENEGKLPEEDKGIQFGYDKTDFKFFNIPNPADLEEPFSYEPSRYDIGDGNGSVFDYVRSTCSHDEFIEALNLLERQIYYPGVTGPSADIINEIVTEEAKALNNNLKDSFEKLDKAQEEYKELHKKWLIEVSDNERVERNLADALNSIVNTYENSMKKAFTEVLDADPFGDKDINNSQFLQYAANEVKKMVVNELYRPSREAQKAMNAEDYKTYNSIDWAKLRRVWEKFPANVNMDEYSKNIFQTVIDSHILSEKKEYEQSRYEQFGFTGNEGLFSDENKNQKLDFVLEKLADAGIEVVTDKNKFESILKNEKILQKMTADLSDFEKLSKQLNDEISKTKELENNVEQSESELQQHNYNEFIEFLNSVVDFIPEEKDFFNKIENNSSYYYRLSNRIPIHSNSTGEDEWIIKPDNNKEKKIYIISTHYTGLLDINNFENVKEYFIDNTRLITFQESLKSFLESRLTLEQQKQNKLLTELANFKTDLLKSSLDKSSVESDFARLDNSLRFNVNFEIESTQLGEDVSVFPGSTGKAGLGIRHIIEERFIKDNLSTDEITALCSLILDTVRTGEITRDSDNRCELQKNGIIAIVRKDFDNEQKNWILTGFHYNGEDEEKNREATEAIKTVIANYSNSDGYSYFRSQVGAVIASLDTNISQSQNKSTYVREQELKNTVKVGHSSSIAGQGLSAPAASILDDGSMFVTQMKTEEIKANIIVKSPSDIVPYLKDFAKSEVENFGVVMLDGSHKVKEIRSVSVGTVNRSLVHVREVFKEAIRNNSTAVLIFHNHPSGNEQPSTEDINTTRELMKAADIIGIPILDHIIVTDYRYFSFLEHDLLNQKPQKMVLPNGITYGFAHGEKIYLNPDVMNSEVAVHEYTHLWDNFIQHTNAELWEKGKNIFKNTHYWNDVKNDPNYADIADNEDLLLSEIHAQLVGKMAEEVLNKILERDGVLTRDSVIDWDKECWKYLENTLWFEPNHNFSPEELHDFLAMPMKDFMNGVHITELTKEKTYNIGGISYTQSQIEEELKEDIIGIFSELSPEPRIEGIRLYQDPEKNNKINILVQYDTDHEEGTWREDDLFNVIAEENILFNGMEVDVNPITPEKSGTIDEYFEHLERLGVTSEAEAIEKQAEMLAEPKELEVYTFAPFGYEGAVVNVETDLRRGIPAYDIVGISDGIVKETRERILSAFRNSGLEFPAERVLQSLSPADLKKDTPLDLSMALSILGQSKEYPIDEPVLALGELELSGGIRPVRGAVAAVNSAKAVGITNVVCDPNTAYLLKDIDGIKILAVKNLQEANEKLHEKDSFIATEPKSIENETVQFSDYYQDLLDSLDMDGHFETIRAIEVAVAGKHNILATGAPGSGKTMFMQRLMPALTPKLTEEETQTPRRISSIAGLDSVNKDFHVPPFRMPHQTASIEGICGGGTNCRPGEISLAHNGTLFLDETAEFRSSVLQMLRVPLESKQITLSRAGRSTSYPANFQLAMATNPCPCGCYGSHDKLCLDSAQSIDLYWRKFGEPLLDRVEIKTFVEKNENDKRKMSIEAMKAQITKAFEIQRKRGVYNSQMNAQQIAQYCKLDKECEFYFNQETENLNIREQNNLLKLSLTLANMDGREEIHLNDLKEARELSAPVFEKPHKFEYQPSEQTVTQPVENNVSEEIVTEEEIAQEKQWIQNKVKQLKEELNNPDNQKGGMNYDEHAEADLLNNIHHFENISDEEIKKQIIWKKENQKNNEEVAVSVSKDFEEEMHNRAVPQDGEMFSYNETHPFITVNNKETGRQRSIQPAGDLVNTVKDFARLSSISEANAVIEKIKAAGFELASTTSRILIYDNEKFFDFDYFAGAAGKYDPRELNDWDFKTFVDNDLKITKKMNEFLQIKPVEQPASKKDIKAIREQCKEILKKPDSEITEADKVILAQYEGAGGLNEENRTTSGILNEFYTPNNLVDKVWQIVDSYAPGAKTVLEPSAGVGKFANNRLNNEFTMHELDETSARINKILHPEANVIQGAYQKQFFDEGERLRNPDYEQPKYDVVIGNPPYGTYNDKYKGLGEGKEFDRYEEYFISKGLDALKDENSVLAFVVPSGFLNTAHDKVKALIAEKGEIIDAYRLPEGTFPTTKVGTDIIIMRSWEKAEKEFHNQYGKIDLYDGIGRMKEDNVLKLSYGEWFKQHPEKVLGEVKTRTNRFGKEEEYVTVHEGLTVQDELNKIDVQLPKIEQKQSIENSTVNESVEKNRTVKQKITRTKKVNTEVEKPKAKVMSAEEFSRLYGRDFDEREFPIWAATNWEGKIDRSKLSFEQEDYLHTSENYVEVEPGEFTHRVLFESGDITSKIDEYQSKLAAIQNRDEESNKVALYERNIAQLEKVAAPKIPMERLHFGVNSTLAEEFMIEHVNSNGEIEKLNLQESFILWAKGMSWAEATDSYYSRGNIDFATANISQEDLPENVSWSDIVEYIDKKSVKAERVSTWRKSEDEIKADKSQKRKEAEEKRMARSETADKLFDKYLHEGLPAEIASKVEAEYNRRFNSYVIPDYSKLPLFIEGMSREKAGKKFKLYDQQIKGVSFLCNKGNGLLAYDVGVGKTATGIVATVNQIQSVRSKRPLIVVPNAVYAKWYKDIQDLFPNIKVNDLYNLNKESASKYRDSENPHKLNIPENSISLITYEGLKNITFTDESCENELFEDYSKLLSEDLDGNDRDNAQSADKIKGVIGAASQIKNTNYVFFEDCGFDNITVDEAHNFKNLWTVPRPKNRGDSNEFAGIPTSRPSARALKLFAMTQLVQRHNEDRNVFLLTATPFTNSPLEVYSMLSYVGRKRLIEAGIYSLRDFCTEFAHTKLELGVNSKGEIDLKQVMKDWKELPALQKILTEFIDKVDGEELKEIIRPKKFTHVQELEMSDLQKEMMEIDTAKMAEVSDGNSAAVIVSMNAMRVGLVAPALADPARYPELELPSMQELVETSPKLKFVCDSVIDMYKNNPEKGQFIYMPLGQSAHGIVKDYLIAHGLPKEAVEIINGSLNNTTEKKAKVTEKFNDPKNKCKILIGGKNTSEGIDLNGNSFVMYNCSLGWNPSETIQAEGRIWRQGNQQGHVNCVYPVMNDSIDSLLYQKHDEKRSRINEIWTYKAGDTLNVEDINPEELKFELIKDPHKRAKLILENGVDSPDFKFVGTKLIQNELNKVNSRIKSFEETYKKRKELLENIKSSDFNIGNRLHNIEDYKNRNLEVPEWCKSELKTERKLKESYEHQLETIVHKFESWGIKTEEDAEEFIPKLNQQKHLLEKELEEKKKELPKILKNEMLKMQEKKVLLPSISEQRKNLTEQIEKNLRPMTEVEPEIRTMRFEQMLNSKWEKGEISEEEKDLYSSVGYKRYYQWLDGEIESLQEIVNTEINTSVVAPVVEKSETLRSETITNSSSIEKLPEEESYNGGNLFSDQELDELVKINSQKMVLPKVHQLITYTEDSGIGENIDFETLSEAQRKGNSIIEEWQLDKADNGFVVFNKETKLIESTVGYFPAEQAFSKEVLLANGYQVLKAKGPLPEVKVSEITETVKERLEEQNATKEHIDNHISFTGLDHPEKDNNSVER